MKARSLFVGALAVLFLLPTGAFGQTAGKKPNILVIWGDDIGWYNPSIYHRGDMGYWTPNIDRIGKEGAMFTSWYGQQSCTAGRAAFITGQSPIRTGLTKVGLPGADVGLSIKDPTVAEVLKPLGYATGQFGKNHLGDKDEFLPTNHGFDEFFGNLYHLNAEEEPENEDYPKNPEFKKKFGPRGVIHSYAGGKIEDTGPLTRKRMETVDTEFLAAAIDFIDRQNKAGKPFFEVKESPRKEFLYWSDDEDLLAVRVNQWKVSFKEQEHTGLDVWKRDFTKLRGPNVYNLRSDPFERGPESFEYGKWVVDRSYLLVPAQAVVGQWLSSFKEFPIRQKPASFNLDSVMQQLSAPQTGSQ